MKVLEIIIVDPVSLEARHGVLLRVDGRLVVRGPGVRARADREDLLRSCVRLESANVRVGFFAFKHLESKYVCFGRVEDGRYVPIDAEGSTVYIVFDLDGRKTVLLSPRDAVGRDQEVLVLESDTVKADRLWVTWDTLLEMQRYTIFSAGRRPQYRLVSGGIEERRDQVTGRVYAKFLPGVTREQLIAVLQGVEAARYMRFLPEERRKELVEVLALPSIVYRKWYIEAREILEDVIQQAKKVGAEVVARYAQAQLERIADLGRIMETLGIDLKTYVEMVTKIREEARREATAQGESFETS
ncbi:MAG TPA: hypothetical protein EYP11_00850 [Aquificaceae bacterium]|nr:hypothetical protein [Aquificaceae bacterium]